MLTVAEGTAIAALGLNVVVAIVGLTLGISRIKDAVRDEIEQHRKEFDDDLGTIRREFGETGHALREKITEVELWGRDNFVKKDSFVSVTDRISREVKEFADRIDKRLERMEGKIDDGHR